MPLDADFDVDLGGVHVRGEKQVAPLVGLDLEHDGPRGFLAGAFDEGLEEAEVLLHGAGNLALTTVASAGPGLYRAGADAARA
jgi:hypothetical protein